MEQPKEKEAPSYTAEIATNNTNHGHGLAFLMRSAHPELSIGTMPEKGPTCGSRDEKKEKYQSLQVIVPY